MTSSFLYFVESGEHPVFSAPSLFLSSTLSTQHSFSFVGVRQELFGSVLSCMYFAVLMLTGQGVPPGDFPFYTKIIVPLSPPLFRHISYDHFQMSSFRCDVM
jgi:hypothetical protein